MSERDILRTIIAEAGGSRAGMTAVANVINNRSQAWHQSPTQVVQARGQFEGYSNPGPIIARQLDDPRLLEQAREIWNSVQNGSAPDPTNGGFEFRASHAANGMPAPNGTVTIAGNTFALGHAASSPALNEINKIVPIPALQQQAARMAYADQPQSSIIPLPIARPTIPSDVGSLAPPPMAQLDPVQASGDMYAGTQAGGDVSMFPGQPSLIGPQFVGNGVAASNFNTPGYFNPESALTSRTVQTVPIDASTGMPQTSAQQLRDAVQALATQRAANSASWQSIIPRAVNVPSPQLVADAAPNVVSDATRDPASEQLNSPSDSFLTDLQNYAARAAAQQNGGWLKTADPQAGNVALPPGVVPKSVQQDMPIVTAMGNGQSWGNAINSLFGNPAPTPSAASIVPRLQPSSAAIGNGDGLTPTQVASIGSGGQNQGTGSLLPNNVDAYTSPNGGSVPAVAAINNATSYQAPTTTYTYQQMVEKNPAYEAYIAKQKANDIGPGPGSFQDIVGNFATGGSTAYPAASAPPQYITVSKKIPLTTFHTVNPASQVMPGIASQFGTSPLGHLYQLATGEPVSGGLLGLLFNHASSTPSSVSSAVSGPAPGTSFLQAQGQNITPNTPDPVVANDFNQALYHNSGGGHFGV